MARSTAISVRMRKVSSSRGGHGAAQRARLLVTTGGDEGGAGFLQRRQSARLDDDGEGALGIHDAPRRAHERRDHLEVATAYFEGGCDVDICLPTSVCGAHVLHRGTDGSGGAAQRVGAFLRGTRACRSGTCRRIPSQLEPGGGPLDRPPLSPTQVSAPSGLCTTISHSGSHPIEKRSEAEQPQPEAYNGMAWRRPAPSVARAPYPSAWYNPGGGTSPSTVHRARGSAAIVRSNTRTAASTPRLGWVNTRLTRACTTGAWACSPLTTVSTWVQWRAVRTSPDATTTPLHRTSPRLVRATTSKSVSSAGRSTRRGSATVRSSGSASAGPASGGGAPSSNFPAAARSPAVTGRSADSISPPSSTSTGT